jgi:hypothetical protein
MEHMRLIILLLIMISSAGVSFAEQKCDYELYMQLEFLDNTINGCLSSKQLNELENKMLLDTGITLFGINGEKVEISDCKSYLGKRVFPKSNIDLAFTGYYKLTCGTIKALKKSKKAIKSYIDNNIPGVNRLPIAIFVPPLNETGEKLLDESQKGITVSDYCRKYNAKYKHSNKELIIDAPEQQIVFSLISVADFDNDGYNDLLIYFKDNGKTSTWHNYGFILISKHFEGQKIYNMRNIYGGCRVINGKYVCEEGYKWGP